MTYDETLKAIEHLIRERIYVDASGLSPHIAHLYVSGYEDAARAVAEAIGLREMMEALAIAANRTETGLGDGFAQRMAQDALNPASLGDLIKRG